MMNPAEHSGRGRGHDQIRVHRQTTTRLAQQQAPEGVVRPQRLHLLEDGRARRRQHAADDDIADLAPGMAADDGERATNPHRADVIAAGLAALGSGLTG